MSPEKFKVYEISELLADLPPELEGGCNYLFDLPTEFGGNLDSAAHKAAKDSLVAFDIRTGQEEAQKIFEQAQQKKLEQQQQLAPSSGALAKQQPKSLEDQQMDIEQKASPIKGKDAGNDEGQKEKEIGKKSQKNMVPK